MSCFVTSTPTQCFSRTGSLVSLPSLRAVSSTALSLATSSGFDVKSGYRNVRAENKQCMPVVKCRIRRRFIVSKVSDVIELFDRLSWIIYRYC